MAPLAAREAIEDGVAAALSAGSFPAPYKPSSPITFRVELASTEATAAYHLREGVSIVGPRTVEASGETFWELWDRFWYRA
jgi:D-aminopeptidase